MARRDARSRELLFPYLTADELIGSIGSAPARIAIDANGFADVLGLRAYPIIYDYLSSTVLPAMQANAEKEHAESGKPIGPRQAHLKKWWKYWRGRGELLAAIAQIPRYIACGQVTKRPIFEFISPEIHPNAALIVFPFADDYSFGILQSNLHFEWFKARCSTLKGDFRYTSDTVFDTFPWPQNPTRRQISEVAAAAVALRGLRREVMAKHGWSLRQLYRTLDEPGDNPLRTAQARLDTAVRTAYAMPKNADTLAFLLALNQRLAEKEKAGERIIPPGLPLPEAERSAFITNDCVQVEGRS